MCKTIKQVVKFQAPPKAVYRLLAEANEHAAFSGKKARVSGKVGGTFSFQSGRVYGRVVDLVPGRRIVLAWKSEGFPEDVFSLATLLLKPAARGGTELTLIHRGVPKDLIQGLEKNWKELYWARMKRHLTAKSPL